MEEEFRKIGNTVQTDFRIALDDIEKGGVAVFSVIESIGSIVLKIGQFIEQIITTIKNTFELKIDHPYLSLGAVLLFLHLVNKV